MEDNAAESCLNHGGLAREISEEKNFSILPRDLSCNILVKKVACFCPCPKSLYAAEVKNFELILLGEEI